MQKYDNCDKKASAFKRLLLDHIDYLHYRIENDLLTMDEIESLAETIANNLRLLGTADDFARFFGQSRTNVSSVLNRRMIEKPVRRVFYSFNTFRKIVPESWLAHKKTTDK